jgi:uncharacterized oxidoreductase
VFDIAAFVPLAEFTAAVEDLRAVVKSSRRCPGVEEVLLPGEPEYRTMQHRREHGIPIPARTWDEVLAMGARLGVEL